jgi:hypothetical protein
MASSEVLASRSDGRRGQRSVGRCHVMHLYLHTDLYLYAELCHVNTQTFNAAGIAAIFASADRGTTCYQGDPRRQVNIS